MLHESKKTNPANTEITQVAITPIILPLPARIEPVEANFLVFGPAGCGKSTRLLREQMEVAAQKGHSIFVLGNRNLYERNCDMLKSHGYAVRLFDPQSMDASDVWHPLSELYDEAGQPSRERINLFVRCMMDAAYCFGSRTDPSVFAMQQHILTLLLLYFVVNQSSAPVENRTKSFHDLITMPNYADVFYSLTCPEEIRDEYYHLTHGVSTAPFHQELRYAMSGYADMFQTQGEERKTAVKLSDLALEKTALFVAANEEYLSTANLLVSFLYEDLFAVADANVGGCCKVPVRIILDEFALLPHIPHFTQYMAISSARDIYTTLCVQSQLETVAIYGKDAQAIIANCTPIDGDLEAAVRHLFETTTETNAGKAEEYLMRAILYAAKEKQPGMPAESGMVHHRVLIKMADAVLKQALKKWRPMNYLCEYCMGSTAARPRYAKFLNTAKEESRDTVKALRERTKLYLET